MQEPTELELIALRIKQLGFQKKFIAAKLSMSPSELSHLLTGKRKYEDKRKELIKFLGLEHLLTATETLPEK